MTEIRKDRRRIIALLTVILVLAALMPDPSHAALTSGKKGTSSYQYLGKSKDGKYYKNPLYGTKQGKFIVKRGGTSYLGYCLDAHKGFHTGRSYTSKTYTSAKDWKAISAARQRIVTLAMIYGYNTGKPAPYGNSSDYYIATQALIWEATEGKVALSAAGTWSKTSNQYDDMLSGRTYGTNNYSWIKKKIAAHVKGASFAARTSGAAKTYMMKYNYSTKKFSAALTDSNKGNTYKRASFTSGLSMSRSGYKYTFSASKAGTYSAVLANNISTGTSQPLIVWQSAQTSQQSTILGATDTTRFYVKLKTESTGKAQIKKTSDDGKVSGFTFNVKCTANGYNANHTTGPTGIIALNLYPGTYTVTEALTAAQKDAGYVAPAAKTITVTSGKTSTITMHNARPKGTAKIVKTSDTGVLQGFSFRIKSADGTYNQKFTTDAKGLITASLYPGKYTITEELTAAQKEEGYKPAKAVTVTIKSKQTKEIPIHNIFEPVENGIKIIKSTTDDGPVEGFRFEITGIHNNSKSITADGIIALASPVVSNMDDYDVGKWTLDAESEDVIRQINEAAESGKTGVYHLSYRAQAALKEDPAPAEEEEDVPEEEIGEAEDEEPSAEEETPKAETVELAIKVKATLDTVDKTTKTDGERTDGTGNVAYWDVIWAGAATTYEGEGITDEEGLIIKEELETGVYTIKEVLTSTQKLRYHEPQSRTISMLKEGETGNVSFENEARTAPVRIKKSCSDGIISGIEFTITGETAWGEEIQPIVRMTDENGYIDAELAAGTYTITETGLDLDYYLPQIPKEITITGDEEEAIEADFINIPYTGISISKKALASDDELPGAVLQILDGETEEVVEEWTSEETPHMVEGLAHGREYILREIKAPPGYQLAEDIRFTAGQQETIEMIDAQTELFIIKMDEDSREPLTGAHFALYDGETEEHISHMEVDEEGRAQLRGLIEEKEYVIRETKAPEGYTPMEDMSFVFTDGMTLEIENGRPELSTQAHDAENGTKISEADHSVAIVDTVEYRNVASGQPYLLKAALMHEDGTPVLDSSGNAVTSQLAFMPSETDGVVDVALPAFDGSQLADKQVVIFESLYRQDTGELMVEHADLDNKDQTITILEQEKAAAVITGDDNNTMYLWGLLLVTSAMTGLCCMGLRAGALPHRPGPRRCRRRSG